MIQFINLLDDRDRLQIILFSNQIRTMAPLGPVGENCDDLTRRVGGIVEGGSTALYDAVHQAFDDLKTNGDPKHIQSIVVLTDGQDNSSTQFTLDQLIAEVGQTTEGGNTVKIFTIAFGQDANQTVLTQIAETTGGKEYSGDPKNIASVYADIATFF